MLLERKSVPVQFKADAAKRQITGYASTFGNVDRVGDLVMPGAYTKTLAEDLPAGRIKVKRNHTALIGKPVHAEQDSTGLLTVSAISKTPLGDETLALVEDGVIDRMSIGYVAEEKRYAKQGDQKVRQLATVQLFEWSFLDDPPANDSAVVVGVKSLADIWMVFSQMQDALCALRTLSYTPADIAARLTALIADMQDVASATESEFAAEVAADAEALSGLLTAFRSTLTPSRSA